MPGVGVEPVFAVCVLSFLQRNVTFSFPASASSLELIRGLGRRSRCRLSISQLDGFSMSRLLLQEVQHTIRNTSLPSAMVDRMT